MSPGVNTLRSPALVAALVISFVIVLIEEGSATGWAGRLLGVGGEKTPGFGVPYLVYIDTLVCFTVLLMTLPLVVPHKVHAQYQGVASLIVGIIVLIKAFALIFVALAKMVVMVALLLAIPFGTIIYLAKWGDFSRGAAAATMGVLMGLKYMMVIAILIAHQLFLTNFGLVLLIATSFIAMLVVSFLHGFVPGIVVSITDAVAGIVVAIIAVIWAILFIIGGIIGIVKVLRFDKTLKSAAP